ncbi:MAG: hypothetical protein DRG78_01665 [Epsilonproteobacteria bacterium]|nr:MAG: hypothetical protein DRG78_01665 [Campylobacterota bacterium]
MTPLKIKTSIISLMSVIVFLIVGTVMYFQYKSSNEFALLTTQKVFDKISVKVINQIENYDSQSMGFINLSKEIRDIDDKPVALQNHTILPIITNYITNANYVYGIYLGFKNDNFYIVYNLDLSPMMRTAQKAPKEARWLIKKNIIKDGKFVSFKEFIDKDFKTILTLEVPTNYQPTKRPWYTDALASSTIIKTNPYIFSSVQQPGVTYAKQITSQGTVLCLDITLSSLSKLLSSQNLVEGSAAFIFKEDGKPVAQFDQILNKKIENLNKAYPNSFIKNDKVIDLEKQKIVTINGKEYLKYTTQLESNFKSKDYLTILSPIDVIMQPYTIKIYKALGITTLILLIFVMPIVIYAIGLLVNPIIQLGRENKKIEEGKFKDVKEVDSFMIEINGLSQSLVSMSKAIEESQKTLESKVEARTSELALEKENVEQILANILLPVFITSKAKRTVIYSNKFAQNLYEMSQEDITDAELDNVYTLSNGPEAIIKEITETGRVNALEEQITTNTGKEFTGLLSVTPITYNNEDCYIGMTVDITEQKNMENEVRAIHKHTRESIEYASLIQGALLPDENLMANYFPDYFVHWMPKDTVGGDIWLFSELRHKDECLLFFIDCTGHGVPGAFVTMIVKAVEREIITKIIDNPDMDVSPAWVMSYFNKTMKILLKQETKDSKSNAGWDGGVIYYNKKSQILKFAGAETPLFYVDANGTFNTVKGNRYSVGYKKCTMDYEYKETTIEVHKGQKFYCTTDGYLDQNGGEKDFPFSKKRFGNIIKDIHTKPMIEQKDIFIDEMDKYESMIENNDRNDDMTVIVFEI